METTRPGLMTRLLGQAGLHLPEQRAGADAVARLANDVAEVAVRTDGSRTAFRLAVQALLASDCGHVDEVHFSPGGPTLMRA